MSIMLRKASTFLLFIMMLVQSFAMAGGLARDQVEEFEHTVLHWSDVGHHHHDGDYHLDDSDESIAHVQSDGWMSALALLPPDPVFMTTYVRSPEQSTFVDADRPPPLLEGPRRPPRPTA